MTSEVEPPADPALEPVEPGYKNVLRVRLLVFWLVLWAARRRPGSGGAREIHRGRGLADDRHSVPGRDCDRRPRRSESTGACITG